MKKVAILESLGISAEALASFESAFAGEVEFAEYLRTSDIPALQDEVRDADALQHMSFADMREILEKAQPDVRRRAKIVDFKTNKKTA